MAGVSMGILPVLLVFLLAQRYLIEGVTLTGMKG
jgi:multiple sugar transport system permease protein